MESLISFMVGLGNFFKNIFEYLSLNEKCFFVFEEINSG